MSADQPRIVRLPLAVLAVVLVLGLWWSATTPSSESSSGSPRSTVTSSAPDTSTLPYVSLRVIEAGGR